MLNGSIRKIVSIVMVLCLSLVYIPKITYAGLVKLDIPTNVVLRNDHILKYITGKIDKI